ncbi:MAG: restriction endonuclease subunit S, partial [Acetobacter sp.]|nr:restriction endonuclease subunit S [Acetobacter sp.]
MEHGHPRATVVETLLEKYQKTPVIWKTIGELGEVVSGKGLTKAELLDSGPVGCIHYGQIYTKYGTSATKTVSFCTEETAAKCTKVYKGDLIITDGSTSKEENIGRGFAWLGDSPIVTMGGHMFVLHLAEEYDPLFLAYSLQSPHFRAQIKKYAVGASFKFITRRHLRTLKIPLPPLEVQKE